MTRDPTISDFWGDGMKCGQNLVPPEIMAEAFRRWGNLGYPRGLQNCLIDAGCKPYVAQLVSARMLQKARLAGAIQLKTPFEWEYAPAPGDGA